MFRQPYPQHLIIKSGLEGVGVFTCKPIKAGEMIFMMSGEVITAPTQTSVQIGENQHIEDPLAKYLNHHCSPSARVVRDQRLVVALRDLQFGEEITFDYTQNEDKMAAPFVCRCCARKVEGARRERENLLTL